MCKGRKRISKYTLISTSLRVENDRLNCDSDTDKVRGVVFFTFCTEQKTIVFGVTCFTVLVKGQGPLFPIARFIVRLLIDLFREEMAIKLPDGVEQTVSSLELDERFNSTPEGLLA